MVIYWYTLKSDGNKIPEFVSYDWDNNYLLEECDKATMLFFSFEEAYTAIKAIYPYATYQLAINNDYSFSSIENFNAHLEELSRNRQTVVREVTKQ